MLCPLVSVSIPPHLFPPIHPSFYSSLPLLHLPHPKSHFLFFLLTSPFLLFPRIHPLFSFHSPPRLRSTASSTTRDLVYSQSHFHVLNIITHQSWPRKSPHLLFRYHHKYLRLTIMNRSVPRHENPPPYQKNVPVVPSRTEKTARRRARSLTPQELAEADEEREGLKEERAILTECLQQLSARANEVSISIMSLIQGNRRTHRAIRSQTSIRPKNMKTQKTTNLLASNNCKRKCLKKSTISPSSSPTR